MSGNFKKEDLRVIKTRKVLVSSLLSLLSIRNFGQLTVNDLCEEALVSRTTFYAHFNDKYDLLHYWMDRLRDDILQEIDQYEHIEALVNEFVHENSKIIINVVTRADSEVYELLHQFMYSIIEHALIRKTDDPLNANQILLSNFCAGGMVNLLTWQVKKNFSPNTKMISPYFYEILVCLMQWDSKQK